MKPKQQKRKEAEERQEKYDSQSLDLKLSKCRTRRGSSLRETGRLNKKVRKGKKC